MKSTKAFFRIVIACLLAVVMTSAVVACKPKNPDNSTNQKYNPEERPLSMSISTPDGVFNPFFATSAYDSSIVGMTQISMLSSDKEGNIVCGDNEPVVVKDYRVTTSADGSNTVYEFIIKNGIKFSDGTPLTIKDVLFNLYVYLDPAYTGSATIYSTKIVGLEQYRMQRASSDIGDDAMSAFEDQFYDQAKQRRLDLIQYAKLVDSTVSSSDKPDDIWSAEEKADLEKDYETVAVEFRKELESDWNNTDKDSYKDWGFTEVWQIFMLNDGQDSSLLLKDSQGKLVKDEDGNYQIDPEYAEYLKEEKDLWLADNAGKTDKDWAIETVYGTYFQEGETFAQKIRGMSLGLEQILTGWVTADTILDMYAAEAKSEHFKGVDRVVPTISGIDGTGKTNTDYHGNALGEEHEVLKITIKGVDPKAIWNFAFTVAPMHYYSSTNYNGKDYIAAFDQTKGEFGLEFASVDFMNNVINAPEKVGLPMGAGTYKASNATGSGTVTADNFFNNNMIYFERNTYFETVGSGLSNAKIKYLRYKVVETDQIINALANGDIDFGDPSATQENIAALNSSGVAHKEVYTSGYGYVGINPRFVPDVTVRRAIMKAMNTSIITQNYYKGGLAELIWRPMSTTSWAYPKGCTVFKDESKGLDYSFDSTGQYIKEMIEGAGYTLNSEGIYQKEIAGFGTDVLDYKFTIAGGTNDHPAYAMFLEAANILNNKCGGFNVKVVTSTTALSDLTTGKLAVWAAAWSSTIDPDMYQIYHKDSLATSVNNWGYKQIKLDKYGEAYSDEWLLVDELSSLIDAGRETVDQEERKAIYADALDVIMELAVEMPTYQRKDMSAYNSELINESTLTPDSDLSPYNGLITRIWEVNYN